MRTETVVTGDTEPVFACMVQSKHCRGRLLLAGGAFVPSVAWLYMMVRTTEMEHDKPLTHDEIRPFVRCKLHSEGPLSAAYNKENGIKELHPLHKTLSLMKRWEEVRFRKVWGPEMRRQSKARAKPVSGEPAKKAPKKFGEMAPILKKTKKPSGDGKKNKKGKH